MEQIIFHIDVNSAFLSWTAVKLLKEGNDVDVRTIPAIIGGDREKRHGIVLAKSISAQKYGIKTGEPVADALKKCPDIMIIPPEHEYYREQSRKFISILKEYTSDIEQVSVDECYFDYTGIQNKFSSYMSAAEVIKNRIQNESHHKLIPDPERRNTLRLFHRRLSELKRYGKHLKSLTG